MTSVKGVASPEPNVLTINLKAAELMDDILCIPRLARHDLVLLNKVHAILKKAEAVLVSVCQQAAPSSWP